MGLPQAQMRPCVESLDEGPLRRITLNRPDAANALSMAMLRDLDISLIEAEAATNVRVVVLAAAGPVFCAGHDLRELQGARGEGDKGRSLFQAAFRSIAQVMLRIAGMSKPVIAEVQGAAVAAGCQLVAQCDLAVASETARFAAPGINLGLFCATPMVALTRSVQPKAAFEMLFTGEAVDAARAREIGLVNRVAPPHLLRSTTDALARSIAEKDPGVVALGKSALRAQSDASLKDAYDAMVETMTANMLRPVADDGVDAFIMRKPSAAPGPRE